MLVGTSGKIFSGIYSKRNESGVLNKRRQDMLMTFSTNVFKDEFYVFYNILKNSPKVTYLSERFLMLYMNTHKGTFVSNRNIDLNRFSGVADSYGEFATSCIEMYKEFESSEEVSDDDFELALEQYRLEYVNEGVDEPDDSDEKLGTICKFGIEPLDEATGGGITEGDMISILGVAKGGKSRFMTYIIHQCLIHGINCVVWSIENGIKGWQALLRARHFDYTYNSGTDNENHAFINDNEIRKGTISGNKASKELAAWTELRTNKSFGRLTVIDEPFDIDTYIETLDAAVKKGSAQVVAVDYLQLIGDATGKRNQQERIAEAYQKTLRYLKANKIAGLFPAQIKQTSVSGLTSLSADELASVETRDIAGASYEVVKTPDINIALVGSVEDIKMGHLKLVSMPSRNSAPFSPVDLSVDFGASNFVVMKKQ